MMIEFNCTNSAAKEMHRVLRFLLGSLGGVTAVILEPGEETDFEALSDAVNVVVKVPGAQNDKYLSDNNGIPSGLS